MSQIKYYRHPEPFPLELGGELPELTIAYHTFGRLNEKRDNVVWVCHALTANSDVSDWWPHTVEKGCFLDPDRWFVVCANILGSHYGTTGPLSVNPATGEPYYADFPKYTIRDMVAAHRLLADHLGLGRIHKLVGSSVGGFQALEWAAWEPERFERLVLIATAPYASPWAIAIDETQRMAIKADATWGERRPDAAMAGLAAARAIGLLTYRGPEGYNLTQQDAPASTPLPSSGVSSSSSRVPCTAVFGGEAPEESAAPPSLRGAQRRPCTYQRYQGEKLCRRYNAYSYVAILDAFDTHDISRCNDPGAESAEAQAEGQQGALARTLASINIPTTVVGLTTDIIFTPAEMRWLASCLPDATYHEIASPFGHDGFLVEHTQLNAILINR